MENVAGNKTKIRFVVIDTITGNDVTDPYLFADDAEKQILVLEQNDKDAGCFSPNTYKIKQIEII